MSRKMYLLFCAIGFGCIALSLFVVENEVEDMRKDLAEIERQIVADKEAIHVLKAEWAYLTRPQRIAELSSKYLDLEPVQSEQFVTGKEISRLPLREPKLASLSAGKATP